MCVCVRSPPLWAGRETRGAGSEDATSCRASSISGARCEGRRRRRSRSSSSSAANPSLRGDGGGTKRTETLRPRAASVTICLADGRSDGRLKRRNVSAAVKRGFSSLCAASAVATVRWTPFTRLTRNQPVWIPSAPGEFSRIWKDFSLFFFVVVFLGLPVFQSLW